jgi:AcrR family transcriptional regulator
MVLVMSLRELENASGMPRSTIYYYIGKGLLPKPQKTPRGRLLYSEHHLSILREVRELKEAGLSLHEIQRDLRAQLERAQCTEIDLAAQEYQRIHSAILSAAAEEFAAKGYKNTHVSGIYKKLGITVNVFYEHFPSKRALFGEYLAAVVSWNDEYLESLKGSVRDPIERLLWSLFVNFSVFELGIEARALLAQASGGEGALRQDLEAGHRGVVAHLKTILSSWTRRDDLPPDVTDDLIAETLYGSADLLFRFSSRSVDRRALIRSHLWTFLALVDARTGGIDTEFEMQRCEPLIDYFATHKAPRLGQFENHAHIPITSG